MEKLIENAILVLFLLLGGFGIDFLSLPIIATIVGLLGLIVLFLENRRLVIPKTFYLYFVFLVLFFISNFWSVNSHESYRNYLVFLAGGFFYLYYVNKRKFDITLNWILPLLGVIFSSIFVYLKITNGSAPIGYTLFWYSNNTFTHSHLGDLWAIAVLVPIFNIIQKGRTEVRNVVLVLIGLTFVTMALSRSGYIALLAGIFTMFCFMKWTGKLRKIFGFVLVFFVVIFLIAGTQKTLLGSREYWIQSVVGIFKYPWGVGVGNFGVISDDVSTHLLGLSSYSKAVHNIVFEMFSGMGVLGVSFAIWFMAALLSLFKNPSKNNILAKSIFMALSVNFLFDFTYFVPTMVWLWFMVLGLSQHES